LVGTNTARLLFFFVFFCVLVKFFLPFPLFFPSFSLFLGLCPFSFSCRPSFLCWLFGVLPFLYLPLCCGSRFWLFWCLRGGVGFLGSLGWLCVLCVCVYFLSVLLFLFLPPFFFCVLCFVCLLCCGFWGPCQLQQCFLSLCHLDFVVLVLFETLFFFSLLVFPTSFFCFFFFVFFRGGVLEKIWLSPGVGGRLALRGFGVAFAGRPFLCHTTPPPSGGFVGGGGFFVFLLFVFVFGFCGVFFCRKINKGARLVGAPTFFFKKKLTWTPPKPP